MLLPDYWLSVQISLDIEEDLMRSHQMISMWIKLKLWFQSWKIGCKWSTLWNKNFLQNNSTIFLSNHFPEQLHQAILNFYLNIIVKRNIWNQINLLFIFSKLQVLVELNIVLCQISHKLWYIFGLVQDCSNSIANALELLQSCTKPSIRGLVQDCSNSTANSLELLQSCAKPSI